MKSSIFSAITILVLLSTAFVAQASTVRRLDSCPVRGDNRDCFFYRELSRISSDALAIAAYGAEAVGADGEKVAELEARLCSLIDKYDLPKPDVCQASRQVLNTTERINWRKVIQGICMVIAGLLE